MTRMPEAVEMDVVAGPGAEGARRATDAFGRVGPLPGDQTPMPPPQRIRGDESGNRVQRPSPEALSLHRQSTTLIVGQPELPATQLLFEDPVLLDQVGDHILLMPVHPTGNRQQEQLERERSGRHPAIVGARNSLARKRLRHDPFFVQDGLRTASQATAGARVSVQTAVPV